MDSNNNYSCSPTCTYANVYVTYILHLTYIICVCFSRGFPNKSPFVFEKIRWRRSVRVSVPWTDLFCITTSSYRFRLFHSYQMFIYVIGFNWSFEHFEKSPCNIRVNVDFSLVRGVFVQKTFRFLGGSRRQTEQSNNNRPWRPRMYTRIRLL